MKTKILIGCVAVLAATAMAADGTIWMAMLSGKGKGKVVWRVRDTAKKNEAKLQGEAERVKANTVYFFKIGNHTSVKVTSTALGTARFEKHYGAAGRPPIQRGDNVLLVNEQGTIIQQGVIQ